MTAAIAATGNLLSSQGPDLPRRGALGVSLEPGPGGAAVGAVTPGSAAEAAGLRPGDVITAIDDVETPLPADVVRATGQRRGGQVVAVEIRRDDRAQRLTATLRPYPVEELAGSRIDYASVRLGDGTRLRTIVSVPISTTVPAPAALLLQGGGCGSVDMPFLPDVAQPGLMRDIARQGFVTLRVEKSGVGDSQGPPCEEIGYAQELEGYRAAFRALRTHPSVDPGRIYLVGLSLGGVFAPVVAADARVAGIVVYGTLAGPPPPYPGRSERFFREIAALDVLGAWRAVDVPVLVLHGEYDEVAIADDHARIAETINAARPGRAEYRELAGHDHCWTLHASMDASRGNCGRGQTTTALRDAVIAFLQAPLPGPR